MAAERTSGNGRSFLRYETFRWYTRTGKYGTIQRIMYEIGNEE